MEIKKSIRGWCSDSYIHAENFKKVYIEKAFRWNGKVDYVVIVIYRSAPDVRGYCELRRETFYTYHSERKALKIVKQIEKHLGKKGDVEHD